MWTFIQEQILGMKWLNVLIGNLLNTLGLDTTEKIGGTIQFFIYDVIKIVVLLCTLIFIISYIQSYFPPERTKKILGRFHGIWSKYHSSIAWNSNTILFLLINPAFYRFYKCRTSAWSNLFIFNIITYG